MNESLDLIPVFTHCTKSIDEILDKKSDEKFLKRLKFRRKLGRKKIRKRKKLDN